jgi:tRNA uridine 5-carbamoylmethylation protein Kti12
LIYLEPPFKTILQQNKSRTATVPEKVIQRLADKSEPPTLLEAHRVTLLS